MNVRRRGSVEKGLRDYIVPIIGLILIIILLFSVFSGDDNKTPQVDLENKIGMTVSLDGTDNESFIVYPGDYKKKIEGDISLYKGEKIMVKNGVANLKLAGIGEISVNKLGELKYLENGNFSQYSGETWINSNSTINVDMRFAKVKIGENSNVALSQNEVGSSIYLVNGFAEVSNLAGNSTVLASGEKITILRLNTSKEDIDLSLLKENISSTFKRSDWFIRNGGNSYIEKDEEEKTGTGKIVIGDIVSNSNIISFDNLEDLSNVSSDSINITGKYSDEEITKITVNSIQAKLDKEKKSFSIEGISTENKENDLVFKVYDDANDLLSRFIYTVYYNGAVVKNNSSGKFKTKTFDVDASQFIFTTIKDGYSRALNGKTSYTTTGDFLTIYGKVNAKGIKAVEVNGYRLKSFNGSSWRYHASAINENLNFGSNIYEVKYYDENGKVAYTNQFTIIKKKIETKKVEETKKDKKIISDEAKI